MKKLFKVFPAALAMLALASCSEIDSIDEKSPLTTSEQGDLIVTVDPFDNVASTRAMRDADGGALMFEEGDQINVYDDELYKYTIYSFVDGEPGYFSKTGGVDLATPTYALFPGDAVYRGYYDSGTGLTQAEFAIPRVINYNILSEQKVGDKMMYAANLPMFGMVTLGGEKLHVNKLRHVCAVLKINLENVKDNVTWLKLSTDNESEYYLSGTFVAVLDASTEEARKAVHLEKGRSDLIVNKDIFINLQDIPSRKATLYIPVMPGIKANVDGLRLDYETAVLTEDQVLAGAGTWTDTGLKFPKEEFKANKLISAAWAFQLTDMTPAKLSALLDTYSASEEDLDFELANGFAIGSPGVAYQDGSQNVEIPALNEDVNVIVTLGENFDEWACDGSWLNITDKDPADPFTGKFTLNVSDLLTTATTAATTPIWINLPSADVELTGDFTKFNTSAITIQAAKSVTFGDGVTETSIEPTALTLGVDNKAMTIAKKAKLKAAINGEAAPVYKGFELTINGQVEGNINLATRFGSKLTIGSDLSYLPAEERTAVIGNVTVGCETVDIALGSEGQAIDGKLTMTGAMADLNMKQGYVNELHIDVMNNGDWENYRYVNVNLEEEVGPVAFMDIVEAAETAPTNKGGWFVWTKSVWAGKSISDVAYAPSGNNYKNKYTAYYELDRAANTVGAGIKGGIFTASQLQSLNVLTEIGELLNDIDANNKNWSGQPLQNDFHGNDFTISNLKLNAGSGLFSSIPGGELEITDLNIDGVTSAGNANGGNGAIAATASASTGNGFTISNVAISGINLVTTAKTLSNVGGVIGTVSASGRVNLKSVTAEGTIQGYKNLGGMFGYVAGVVTSDNKCNAQVAVSNNKNAGKAMDLECATIGGFIGSVSGIAMIAAAADPIEPVHTYADKEYLSDTSVSTGDFFYYEKLQNYVGYSGNNGFAAAIMINGKNAYPARVGNAGKKYDNSNWGANDVHLYTLLAQ